MSILQSIISFIISFIVIMGFVFGMIGLMFYQRKPKGYLAEMDCKAHNEKLLKELEDLKGETTMSKRMNKDRVRENIKKLKEVVKQYNKMIVPPQKECSVYIGEDTLYLNDEMLESLDIAIDSLENEWVDVRKELPSEDKDYFVTIKSRIDYADKYYIVLAHWEKSTTDKSVKGWWTSIGWNRAEEQHLYDITNDVVAWKKVEPYERKE